QKSHGEQWLEVVVAGEGAMREEIERLTAPRSALQFDPEFIIVTRHKRCGGILKFVERSRGGQFCERSATKLSIPYPYHPFESGIRGQKSAVGKGNEDADACVLEYRLEAQFRESERVLDALPVRDVVDCTAYTRERIVLPGGAAV